MACYAVPASAAIIHYFMKKKNKSMDTVHHKWLNLLLTGGATFGLIDHWYNGELFSSPDIVADMTLGVTITLVIFMVWGAMVWHDKLTSKVGDKVSQ